MKNIETLDAQHKARLLAMVYCNILQIVESGLSPVNALQDFTVFAGISSVPTSLTF